MLRWSLFAALSAIAVVLVVRAGLRDAADPARCGALVATGAHCCAEGQRVENDRCAGAPAACPAPLSPRGDACLAGAAVVRIDGGTLHAGAGDWEAEGRVAPHDAVIAPFVMSAYEYRAEPQGDALPVSDVTREEAARLCAKQGGRLPTDDEWTWAAGGAKARRYPWGDTGAVCRRAAWGQANGPCFTGANGPSVAGSHPDGATPEGVHDLAGNVAEWVSDGDGAHGFVRGGSWADALATDLRTWQRRAVSPGAASPEIGFRCAFDLAKSP